MEKKVHCHLHDKYGGKYRWIGKVSAKAHLVSLAHQKAVEVQVEQKATRAWQLEEAERALVLNVPLKMMSLNLVSYQSLAGSTGHSALFRPVYNLQDLYLSHDGMPIIFVAGDNGSDDHQYGE